MTTKLRVGIVLAVAFCISLNVHARTNDPCGAVGAMQGKRASLENQIANERNPIRRDGLNAQLAQSITASHTALANLVNVDQGRFTNLSGRVTAFDTVGYNTGPGARLGITLSCGVAIGFQFVEIRNPAWGNMNPKDQTPLVPWRRALETIVVGDTVTFSGRFSGYGDSRFGAVLTRLQKRGGSAFEVADAYMPASSTKLISHAGLSWMPAVNAGNWQEAQTYCAQLRFNGQTGWRMPAQHELQNLLASGAAAGQAWQKNIWTSTPWPREWPYSNGGYYAVVDMAKGRAHPEDLTASRKNGISCVLGAPSAAPPKLVFFKEGKNDNDRQQDESRCSMDEINGQLKGRTWTDCMVQKGWQLRSPDAGHSTGQASPAGQGKGSEVRIEREPQDSASPATSTTEGACDFSGNSAGKLKMHIQDGNRELIENVVATKQSTSTPQIIRSGVAAEVRLNSDKPIFKDLWSAKLNTGGFLVRFEIQNGQRIVDNPNSYETGWTKTGDSSKFSTIEVTPTGKTCLWRRDTNSTDVRIFELELKPRKSLAAGEYGIFIVDTLLEFGID